MSQNANAALLKGDREEFPTRLSLWQSALILAAKSGWLETGTVAPKGWDGYWNRDYMKPMGQVVASMDAYNLGEALREAIGPSDAEEAGNLQGCVRSEDRGVIRDLVAFCRRSSGFEISEKRTANSSDG